MRVGASRSARHGSREPERIVWHAGWDSMTMPVGTACQGEMELACGHAARNGRGMPVDTAR